VAQTSHRKKNRDFKVIENKNKVWFKKTNEIKTVLPHSKTIPTWDPPQKTNVEVSDE
jgi:hypothetical protein